MTFRECQDKPIYSEGLPKKAGGGGAGGARIVSRFKGGGLGAGKKEAVVF